MGRRLVTLAAATALVAPFASPAVASGPGEPAPWYLDQHGGDAKDMAALYSGRLGVVMANTPRPQLLIAWRLLHDAAVGNAVGLKLSIPCCDGPRDVNWPPSSTKAWLDARKPVPGAADIGTFITLERRGANYASTPNCFPDALETAANTLKNRIAAHGAASPEIKAWLTTQDAVFAACEKPEAVLPPPLANAPAWLKADRAYQEAAFTLYSDKGPEAAQRFVAIGRDKASPWAPMATYLVARATMSTAINHPAPTSFAAAHKAVDALASAPAGTYGQSRARGMGRALKYREDPAHLMAELDREVNLPAPTDDIDVSFRDLSNLGDAAFSSGGADAQPEVIDWMRTLKSLVPTSLDSPPGDNGQKAARLNGLKHAVARYSVKHDKAWLLAALSLADPDDADIGALLLDAGKVAETSPAWLSVQYHLARLTLARSPAPQTRARLDGVLARRDLSIGDRNLFTAVRLQVAEDAGQFAKLALRVRICADNNRYETERTDPDANKGCFRSQWIPDSYQDGGGWDKDGREGTIGLGQDARAVIDRMPLNQRMALGRDQTLPEKLRLDIVLTSFARAVDLQDDAAIDALAGQLVTLLPQLAADWRQIVAAPAGPDKRFALWLVLAKVPGLRTDLVDYTRPEGKLANFQGTWTDWIVLPKGTGLAPQAPPPLGLYQSGGYGAERAMADAQSDLSCLGECGRGAAPLRTPDFVDQQAAGRERSFFLRQPTVWYEAGKTNPAVATPPGSVSVWEEILSWVAAHPDDARNPEALYWLVHVGHFGGSHNHSGRRAFKLLKSRYASSPWAAKVKYYYD